MMTILCLHVEIVFFILILAFFIFGIIRKNKSENFDVEVLSFALFIIIVVFSFLLSFYLKMDFALVIECLDGDLYVSKFINLLKMFILCVFGVFIIIFFVFVVFFIIFFFLKMLGILILNLYCLLL